eukprot:2350095-Alexandrium_andersonii.AAC.1
MQLCLYPIPDKEGEYSVVKHLTFRDEVKPAYAVKFAQGDPHNITWPHPKVGMKIWQYMFENLGGVQSRQWALTPS